MWAAGKAFREIAAAAGVSLRQTQNLARQEGWSRRLDAARKRADAIRWRASGRWRRSSSRPPRNDVDSPLYTGAEVYHLQSAPKATCESRNNARSETMSPNRKS